MRKKISTIVLSTALFVFTFGGSVYANTLEDRFFVNKNPTLDKQERQALEIAKKWQIKGSSGTISPFPGRNGAIQFVFGAQSPSVVCAVLQVCDIALRPGEHVNSIQLGDTVRWNVEPAISGIGPQETQHLLIKPIDVGLKTSLVVTTDRRVYHIRLRSHRTKYMPYVAFKYPEDTLAKWDRIQAQRLQYREDHTLPRTREYLDDLSFNYDIEGFAPWKPVRVFNDGYKTIIQMPRTIRQLEAPALLVVRKDGTAFANPETIMVNYRVQGDRYIVDTVFYKAILISGVGLNQEKITITRRGA